MYMLRKAVPVELSPVKVTGTLPEVNEAEHIACGRHSLYIVKGQLEVREHLCKSLQHQDSFANVVPFEPTWAQ